MNRLLALVLSALIVLMPVKAEAQLLTLGVNNITTSAGGPSITFDNSNGALGASTTGILTATYVSSTLTHGLMALCIVGDTTIDQTITADYNGSSFTFGSKIQNPGGRWLYEYYLLNPASGSHTLTINGTSGLFIIPVLAEYAGVKQTSQPDAMATPNSGVGTSLTTPITILNNGSWPILCGQSSLGGWSSGTGATFRVQDATFTNSALYDSNGPVSPGSYNMTVNSGGAPAVTILSFQPG